MAYRFEYKGLLYEISSDEDGIGITCLAKPEEVGLRDPYSMEREAAAAEVLNLVEEIAELKARLRRQSEEREVAADMKRISEVLANAAETYGEKESPMPEHVYVFAHEGVRWSLDHDRLVSEPLVGSINFLTLPDRALAAEVFRLAAENQRLNAALDGATPAPAKERQKAVDDFLRALLLP